MGFIFTKSCEKQTINDLVKSKNNEEVEKIINIPKNRVNIISSSLAVRPLTLRNKQFLKSLSIFNIKK